jgi:glycosyltransferase involved in cell wall biosynthesis
MENPPLIPRIKEIGSVRPFCSVMIPTYNPRVDYLEETLHSVLQQDPGPEQMQIEVIDDCSSDDLAAQTARRVGGGRVTFHAEHQNRGLANTWNRCIERARGNWVHILHQDDTVLPGFYERLRQGAEQSDAGAAFCRYAVVNSKGHWLRISELYRESAGLLDDWHAKITIHQLIQCPAIAVRRLVYEQLGGFLPRLRYTPDWEMWQRVASQFSFWFEPSILACYRTHRDSATSRLRLDAADARELREVIHVTKGYHTPARGRMLARKARTYYAVFVMQNSRQLLVTGHSEAAWRQIREAFRLSRSWSVFWQFISFLILRTRIAGASLKRRFFGKGLKFRIFNS